MTRTARLSCAFVLLSPLRLHAQSFCEAVAPETLVAPIVLGNGTPGSVTTTDIQNALNAGGHITFNVGSSPTTIVVSSTLVINRAVVLDGGGVVTLSGGSARRVLLITNTMNQIYSITLQNISFAFGSTPAAGQRGAAIYKQTGDIWQSVSLKLVNTSFQNNAAVATGQDDGGGALYATGMDHVRIGNSSFTNNTGSNGGAVYFLGTRQVTIVDSVFSGNQATGTGGNPGNGGNAGALGVDGADRLVDVCRTRFTSNTSNAHGAGFFSVMYDATSRSRFEDVTFEGNNSQSDADGLNAGGAYIQNGPFAFERVTFLNNQARGFGGVFIVGSASGTIRNSTFVGNLARVSLGGAMGISASAPVSIVNSTIAYNSAPGEFSFAGGISIGAGNQLRLTNVILANNTGGNAFNPWNIQNPAGQDGGGNMQWPTGQYEVQATPTSQFANPLLVSTTTLRGGFVPTLAFTAGSPARDTAASTGEVPATDARGMPRVGAADRGAFEFDPPLAIVDFDADLRTDITVYHEPSGTWYSRPSSTGTPWNFGFGGADLEPVSGDYDGDGTSDLAVYHEASGLWYVRQSSSPGTTLNVGFGGVGYTPVAGDYDGDERTDIAVYHQPSGLWFVRQSSTGTAWSYGFGGPGFAPVAGDFDGDGRTDVAVYHAPSALWFVRRTASNDTFTFAFGGTGFTPLPRDYDGDSRIDVAVYHEASGLWYVRQSSTDTTASAGYGGPGFLPVPADYDGDGRADFAVYHPPSGLWFVRQTTTGTTFSFAFGGSAFTPVNP